MAVINDEAAQNEEEIDAILPPHEEPLSWHVREMRRCLIGMVKNDEQRGDCPPHLKQ